MAERAGADAPAALPEDVAAMTFEDALAELEGIVQRLEQGKGALDAAIDAYERGSALRRHCENKLKDARVRVERITLVAGSAETSPFDVD